MSMRITPDQPPQRKRPVPVTTYFGYLMVVVYLGLGLLLLFSDLVAGGLPQKQRMMLGGLLLVYALYRGYSVVRNTKKHRDENIDQ